MQSASKMKIYLAVHPLVVSWCFIFSGAASVSYQIIWLRQAMTYFGVITPVISSVLSVFMLGLALGTVLFAKFTLRLSSQKALGFYIVAEILIALLALLVPMFFEGGHKILLGVGNSDSTNYLFLSWLVITLVLLPVCTLIGATLPLIMTFLKENTRDENNFSLLYFANLLGGVLGCLLPLLLIELYGFSKTLWLTAASNILAALLALYVYLYFPRLGSPRATSQEFPVAVLQLSRQHKLILFVTGLAALGCEVIWIKLFMPATGTSVYAFSLILAMYLIFNSLGVFAYRSHHTPKPWAEWMTILFPLTILIPFMAVASQPKEILAVFGIAPFCFLLGYVTPYIIDSACRNNPLHTCYAYLYNLLGCIAGPLLTTYILFPALGLKGTLIVYAVLITCAPFFLGVLNGFWKLTAVVVWGAALLATILANGPEEDIRENGKLYRDYTGYIGAMGEGGRKRLLVNGVSMTKLTTVTKNMAHIPMQYFPEAKSALIICFGMGTTVRSLAAWPLERIAVVELSEGVVNAFPYFHNDASQVLKDPRVQVIIDDGRRYLNRTQERYDVITIDPPPPIHASGSGLLYSKEFYSAAKSRLSTNGVLAQWLPSTLSEHVKRAVLYAIKKNFKHVVIYKGLEELGMHFIASDHELPHLTPEEFIENLPEEARKDLLQWKKKYNLKGLAFDTVRMVPVNALLNAKDEEIMISDDMPYNEFYLLRKWGLREGIQ